MTPLQQTCGAEDVDKAIEAVIDSFRFTYQEIIYRMPEKQKTLLIAIAREGEARAVTSGAFVIRYRLISASSVQSSLKVLLETHFSPPHENHVSRYQSFLAFFLRGTLFILLHL